MDIKRTHELLIEYENEIERLKEKIVNLEYENSQLKISLLEQRKSQNYINKVQNSNKALSEDKINKTNRIKVLEDEMLKLVKKSKEENRLIEKNLESEILYYKGLNETGKSKFEAAEKIIKLNETQHNYILKLENKIDNMKNEYDKETDKLKIEHELNFYNLKKQMMEIIRKTQSNLSKKNADNLELNIKFGALYKNQILNELENQSSLIKDLLKQKEKLKKIIYGLKQEINLHENVEKIIIKKKDKYLKLNEKKTEDKNDECENLKAKKINMCIKTTDNNSSRGKNNLTNFSLKKGLFRDILEQNKMIKCKYNFLKQREIMTQNKYKGVIHLLEQAFEEIISDEEIKNKKNIFININELNKGNFEKFTKEEKYFILVKIINHLLPIIKIDLNGIDLISFKQKMKNIKFKINKSKVSKFIDTSRSQTFYDSKLNGGISDDNKLKYNGKNKFISVFSDDYIQYGNKILEKDDLKKIIEMKKFQNKKKIMLMDKILH